MIATPTLGTLPHAILELLLADFGDLTSAELADHLDYRGFNQDPTAVSRVLGRLTEAGYILPRRYRLFPWTKPGGSPRQRRVIVALVENGPLSQEALAAAAGGCDSEGRIQGSWKRELDELRVWGAVSPPRCPWLSVKALELLAPKAGSRDHRLLSMLRLGDGAREADIAEALGMDAHGIEVAVTQLRHQGWLMHEVRRSGRVRLSYAATCLEF